MLESCILRLGGGETWVLGGRWVQIVELGDYEAGVVVDVTTNCAGWNAAVGDSKELEVWAWENDWLDLLANELASVRDGRRWHAHAFSVWDVAHCKVPDQAPCVW